MLKVIQGVKGRGEIWMVAVGLGVSEEPPRIEESPVQRLSLKTRQAAAKPAKPRPAYHSVRL